MLRSGLTHGSITCKVYLNMHIENALYKFNTIFFKTNVFYFSHHSKHSINFYV